MRGKKLTAIVLRLKDAKDADKYVTLFTKEEGKLTVLAKGIKKLGSRKSGLLTPGSEVSCEVYEKSDGFLILTEVELLRSFTAASSELSKIAMTLFVCDVASSLLAPSLPHIRVYNLLMSHLSDISSGGVGGKRRSDFTRSLLTELGFLDGESRGIDMDSELALILNRVPGSVRVGKKLVS
jgi:DNA repair protein RecO (recombination protein O)